MTGDCLPDADHIARYCAPNTHSLPQFIPPPF